MENDRKNTYFLSGLLREFATIFTLLIICFSLIGKFFSIYASDMQNFSTLFVLEGAGLPYNIILQAAVFAFIMALVSKILFSENIEVKTPILKHIIFMFITFLITSIFSIFFNWFPINNIYAWLLFVPSFFISCFTATALSLLLLKLEDKKYNKLLENYKKQI